MSYWVSLHDENGDIVDVETFEEGGTQVVGGSTEADLNVTYNYGKPIRDAMVVADFPYSERFDYFGVSALHGQRAGDTITTLEVGVTILGTEQDDDYWAATPGNAGYALNILLGWARQYPDAVWNVN